MSAVPGSPAPRPIAERPTLAALRRAARTCRACDLWRRGTQTGFGEGAARVDVMLVGEQPGDGDDLAGRPFVGPAGRVLAEALEEAGLDRERVYLRNVVKHFKWHERGKRRIHDKPSWIEIRACRPWLQAELTVVRPRVLVCLSATAAQALLGRDFRVSRRRGELIESDLAPTVLATVHPSSVLRGRDDDRRSLMRAFADDLRVDARAARPSRRAGGR